MLELDNIGKRYPGSNDSPDVWALQDVSVDVAEGECVAIVGPSGCGKTTLLQIIAGLRPPSTGTAKMDGTPISGPDQRIGVVFQESSVFPWLTTEENIAFGLQHRGWAKVDRRTRTQEMVELVGLGGFEKHYPAQLSGGMRQRVALARELASQPKLLLLDEPFAALDEQTRLLLGDELLRIMRETQCTVVLITHSLTEAAMMADRVAVLSRRPGCIKEIIPSTLDGHRSSDSMGKPEFREMTGRLWELLKEDASEALNS